MNDFGLFVNDIFNNIVLDPVKRKRDFLSKSERDFLSKSKSERDFLSNMVLGL